MREIKFRGKRVDNGEWVYGYLLEFEDMSIIFECKGSVLISSYSSKPLEYISSDFWVEVIPETVGQFVGLKDKNGKEIYEGDIVDGEWEVRWWDDDAEFVLCNPIGEPNINICAKEEFIRLSVAGSEVIGNIHENPELLEAKE